MSMTQHEAEQLIKSLWMQWPDRPSQGTRGEATLFHAWLRREHPYALDFSSAGDKAQVIQTWMANWRRHLVV